MTLSAIVGELADRIGSISAIGLVWSHPFVDKSDLRNELVSQINGHPTLRSWWIDGPEMRAEAQGFTDYARREWTFTIHGLEGLSPAWLDDNRGPGGDIVTLRDNASAVTDVLDADQTLAGTCAKAWPSNWPVRPEHRTFAGGVVVSYVQIQKRVTTL